MKAMLLIDMPDNCRDCILCAYSDEVGDYYCTGTDKFMWMGKIVVDGGKYTDCPLKPAMEDEKG